MRTLVRAVPAVFISLAVGLAALGIADLHGQMTAGASVGDRIPLEGLAAANAGLAFWNTGPDAGEPAQLGHATPWTPCSASAPYYLATRDYDDLDPASNGGFHGMGAIRGLPGVSDALATNGFTARSISGGWSAQSLGDDVEGIDWTFDAATGVETRYYRGGGFGLQLNGESVVGGPMAPTTVRIDYQELNNCGDDGMTVSSETVTPLDRSTNSSPPVQAVAAALLADLAGHGLNVVIESVGATAEAISANGRTGAFFDATSGGLEVDAVCSCALGIAEADDTHDWTLRWPDATLPENGPVRLKVVAETVDGSATETPPGRLTVTVFDESALDVGTVVDVPYPATMGTDERFVELNILPQTTYAFTVRHTGAGRHYRLGASHAMLRVAQSDLRYLPARSQDRAIEAAADERVTLELVTDTDAEDTTQATSAIVTVFDIATNVIVFGPSSVGLEPDTPQTVQFANGAVDRGLMVQVEPDGDFRMKKVGGDEGLYSLACPLRDGPTTPMLTITDAGVTPQIVGIEPGQQVFLINQSSSTRRIQSDPHPIHTVCPSLNLPGTLAPGDSGLTGVLETEGTCGFHDHFNPGDATMRGSVQVGAGGSGTGDGGEY